MAGIVHLRIVVAIFVIGGIVSLLPYGLSFLVDGMHTSPFGLISAIGSIAIGVWLSRGSEIARYILIVISIFGLLLCGLVVFLVAGSNGPLGAALGLSCVLTGYCLWVLMFSKDVRTELARRRDANAKQESDERRRFYEQLGEKSE